MNPFECYKMYLSLKNHFTKDKYDFHKYCGKSRASVQAFYKRKDRYFFEKLSRQKTKEEIIDFFVSNFVSVSDPSTLWIGQLMREGEKNYIDWKKRNQSLTYNFKSEMEDILTDKELNVIFERARGHPIILKKYLSGKISIETLSILDKIFGFVKDFDEDIRDPVWEVVSKKIKKYSPFLNIDIFAYKKSLREIVL
nr:loader of gp41 DNA helicase [uncultured Mediterranean phage uvMED]|tara:strand:- start:20920 stop:21507 length:588 start_codon:yes stop_codon:yes gene_type:complete